MMSQADYDEETMRRDTDRMLIRLADNQRQSHGDPDFYPCPTCGLCLCCDCTCEGGPVSRTQEAWAEYDALFGEDEL